MTTEEQYGTSELERDFGRLTFGNALSSYRIGEEKSQRAFAYFLGISPQSLCDIEKERRIPSPSRQPKLPDNSTSQKASGFSLPYRTCYEKKT